MIFLLYLQQCVDKETQKQQQKSSFWQALLSFPQKKKKKNWAPFGFVANEMSYHSTAAYL